MRYSDASDSDCDSDSPSVSGDEDDDAGSVSSLSSEEDFVDLNKLVFRRIKDKGKLAKSNKSKSIEEILEEDF